jgi:hypothetical protein
MTAITISIWHNVRTDPDGRHPAMLDGYIPGDPMVRVFTYQTQPRGRTPGQIAEDAFAAFNGHPTDAEGVTLAGEYYGRRLRSLSAGDAVVTGDVALAAGRPAGWTPVSGDLNESRASQHGTHPLPEPGWLPDAST